MSQAIASFPLDFNSTASVPRAPEPARSPREPEPPLGPTEWQPRRSKRLLLPVLGLHAVMAWGLVQMGVVPMPSRPAPVEVKLMTVPPPKTTPPPAARPTLAPQFQQLTVPPVTFPRVGVHDDPADRMACRASATLIPNVETLPLDPTVGSVGLLPV